MLLTVITFISFILAFYVIYNNNLLYSVLALIGVITIISLILIILDMNYVGFVYLLVYVGAVLILLLFTVLSVEFKNKKISNNVGIFFILLIILSVVLLSYIMSNDKYELLFIGTNINEELLLGNEFYSSNSLNLFLLSLLLLLGMVGAISLSLN